MNIELLHLTEGARQARGLTVIIDVFRAFSVAAYAFHQGIQKIFPVGSVEEAWQLKNANPDFILVGERNEDKVPGFDFGNSPSHLLRANLQGKSMIHTTSAGTRGLVNAINADEIITGAFVNADAIVRYILSRKPEYVSLVCMGYAAQFPVEEDSFCAEYIQNELTGITSDLEAYKQTIRNTSGMRFFDPEKQHFAPSEDFDLCLNFNRFNIVIKAETEQGKMVLQPISDLV